MKKIIVILISIVSFLIIYSFLCAFGNSNVKAINGVMNLKNWNFKQSGIIKLDGQWELYNNKLLTPEKLKNEAFDKYLTIPSKLETQLDGEINGYMTLRLKIYAEDNVVYGFRIPRLLSASKVWVNGVLQGEAGKVGKNFYEEKAIYLPVYSYFTAEDGVIDIIIQTSNYRNIFPIINSFEFGLKDQILNLLLLNSGMDLIIIGSLLIIELIFLSLYNKVRERKDFFYFSILCLFIQLRCAFLNERIIVHFFPQMPYELLSKTAAITFYLWVPIYVIFLKEQFPRLSRKLVLVSTCFGTIFSFICLVTDNIFYDRLSFLSEILLVFIIAGILITLIKEVKNKSSNSNISLIAFFVLVITTINDIMVNNGGSYNRYVFQLGMFVFAFLETHLLTINYVENMRKTEKLKIDNQIIYEKSIRDGLTSLYNRSYIDRVLDKMLDYYTKHEKRFTLMMIDVDYFKAINDNYGHVFGDKVLVSVSKILMESLRPQDYIGRYGGEEFIVILPNTEISNAKIVAEKIRLNVENLSFENGIKVTISIGVYQNDTSLKHQCIEMADKLLYSAKERGRNRVEISEA